MLKCRHVPLDHVCMKLKVCSQSSYGLIYQSIQSLTDHRHEKAGLPLGPPVRSVQIHAPRHNPLRDLRQIETDHENHQQSWLQSETCKKLQEYLCTADLPRIEKIVAFGLGDFSFHDDGSHHTQHAAIATLAGILKRRQSGHSLQCYVQDPAYSDADKEFLEKRGLVVLRDPQAFLEVDETTLVFTASPNVPVRQVVADLARPAALLWETTPPTLEGEIENFRKDLVQGGDFSETDVNGRPQ